MAKAKSAGNVIELALARKEYTRPRPPVDFLSIDNLDKWFLVAADVEQWLRSVFVNTGSPLENPDHAHLQSAKIGVVWTVAQNRRHGLQVLAQVEFGKTIGGMGKMAKARAHEQLRGWFGDTPDFLLTIDAEYAANCADDEFCALIEHELYHMGQAKDEFGAPAFTRSGLPIFSMRGHDVEEFVGVVARYGASATRTAELVQAANRGASISSVRIAQACGTCLERRVA